jgi:hypothetical protein
MSAPRQYHQKPGERFPRTAKCVKDAEAFLQAGLPNWVSRELNLLASGQRLSIARSRKNTKKQESTTTLSADHFYNERTKEIIVSTLAGLEPTPPKGIDF